VTSPSASSVLSAVVATVKVCELCPAAMVTVRAPSSVPARKSLPVTSVTVTCTARFAAGAGDAPSVNSAPVPSVTADPPLMLISGSAAVLATANTGERP